MNTTPIRTIVQIDQWFSILQRGRLTAPNFADLHVLEERVIAFIQEWNPFN